LLELLHRDVKTALVFTRTKHRANRLAKYLDREGIACDRIHGNRSQPQRETALAAFKAGRIRVLVATDVASRGIDIEALPHVINFDVPRQPDDYVHRVGRTARAGTTGDALTFVSPAEEGELRAIERTVGKRIDRRRMGGYDLRGSNERPAEPAGQVDRNTLAIAPRKRRRRGARRGAGSRANGSHAKRGSAPTARSKPMVRV
jgi:ATP-dependent RNA helicase RhlE